MICMEWMHVDISQTVFILTYVPHMSVSFKSRIVGRIVIKFDVGCVTFEATINGVLQHSTVGSNMVNTSFWDGNGIFAAWYRVLKQRTVREHRQILKVRNGNFLINVRQGGSCIIYIYNIYIYSFNFDGDKQWNIENKHLKFHAMMRLKILTNSVWRRVIFRSAGKKFKHGNSPNMCDNRG
jgi:hypothetical protein